MHGQPWSSRELGAIDVTPALWESGRGNGPTTPEQRLMAAVLEDAVRELTQPKAGSRAASARRQKEITEWFASDDVAWPFSFVNVCEALDLAPDRLRARLCGAGSTPPAPRTG